MLNTPYVPCPVLRKKSCSSLILIGTDFFSPDTALVDQCPSSWGSNTIGDPFEMGNVVDSDESDLSLVKNRA